MTFTFALVAPSTSAALDETHFFNATHSLTGDCTSSPLDPVPDPGCPEGDHPAGPFEDPKSVALDLHGNMYVSTEGPKRIDIFDSAGYFITELSLPLAIHAAVDSAGILYVCEGEPENRLVRLTPSTYEPAIGNIEYANPPVLVQEGGVGCGTSALAVNYANDHVYLAGVGSVVEYGSAAEGNPIVTNAIGAPECEGEGIEKKCKGGIASNRVALDVAHKRIYISGADSNGKNPRIEIFGLEPPYPPLGTIDGSTTPSKTFFYAGFGMAVDEATGRLFVYHNTLKKVYEFEPDGTLVWTFSHPGLGGNPPQGIAFDNSPLSPRHRFFFVPSGDAAPSHVYAFEPKFEPKPPVVESLSFSNVDEAEALLRAKINPKGSVTHFVFEYVTQGAFEESGFSSAAVAGEGDIAAGGEGVSVFRPAMGLAPGTLYRFRVRAESECEGCSDEEQGTFTTFPHYAQSGTCPNGALRVGPSAALPDCRAYELVTPAETKGRTPYSAGDEAGYQMPSASAGGDSLAFKTSGGALAGVGGAGGFKGDHYVAARMSDGWRSHTAGPSGVETTNPFHGGLSADHGYADFTVPGGAQGSGTLAIDDNNSASWIRYPDGSFHLAGQGSLGNDIHADVKYLAAGGKHIVFLTYSGGFAPGFTAVQLEPNAPPDGTGALYDRTPDGVTRVVSLLPGEVTPGAGENPLYEGISEDGSSIAFRLGGVGPLYVRVDNAETLVAGPTGAAFAGLSREGHYLFYLHEGDLQRFDTESEETLAVTETGDVTPVYVASQGTAAYFLSPSVIGEGFNPNGAAPQAGKDNLYHWDGAQIRFVATVTERDAKGAKGQSLSPEDGLGLWMDGVRGGVAGWVSAEPTPDGAVLLFASRADLADSESGGVAQIYRYDSVQSSLECLSCDQTGAAPGTDARLRTPNFTLESVTAPNIRAPKLSPDGRRAFFESSERLVPTDNNGVQDVYEWEAQGKGSCAEPGGCLFLISSGQSPRPSYLFGVSESGNDVFFHTADLLVPEDGDETPSIYDARVDGGFEPSVVPGAECLGEACQPAAVVPDDATPTSAAFQGQGNVAGGARPSRCPKGKRRVRRAGKTRCVTSQKKQKRQRKRAHAKGRAGK